MNHKVPEPNIITAIGECRTTLAMSSDSLAVDRFREHLNTRPGIADQIDQMPESKQVAWLIRYWGNQFEAVGLETTRYYRECEDRGINTIHDVNVHLVQLISYYAGIYNLPRLDAVIPDPPSAPGEKHE